MMDPEDAAGPSESPASASAAAAAKKNSKKPKCAFLYFLHFT